MILFTINSSDLVSPCASTGMSNVTVTLSIPFVYISYVSSYTGHLHQQHWPCLQGIDKFGSTKSTQSDSASSQGTTPPSTPLRVLRRSGSSLGSGGAGGSFRHGSTGPRTLMFFKGCPRPLGCTVLLKGADASQLILLKKVTKVLPAVLQHLPFPPPQAKAVLHV